MIQCDNLTKFFGPVMAIDRVSFQVERGEIVGFLGPNGAGKTTTMRIMTSFLPATSGTARVYGFDVMNESMQVRQNIGYLPESVPLYPEMRVDEYLLYRAKLKGVGRTIRSQRLDYVLDHCRIREVRRRLIGTLSKGYRQRVGLADALIHDPPILILDEPTTGLDPIQIRETLSLIRVLSESHTILLSTHILSEVEAVCERVIIINSGRISLSKTLDELESQAIILLEARGPLDRLTQMLRGLDGVTHVEGRTIDDGISSFEIRTRGDDDLRESLCQATFKHNWPIRRLERKRRRLEDAFFDVLRQDDPLKETSKTGIQDLSAAPSAPQPETAVTAK